MGTQGTGARIGAGRERLGIELSGFRQIVVREIQAGFLLIFLGQILVLRILKTAKQSRSFIDHSRSDQQLYKQGIFQRSTPGNRGKYYKWVKQKTVTWRPLRLFSGKYKAFNKKVSFLA